MTTPTPILTLEQLDEIEHDIKSGHVVFGVQNCAVTNSIRLSKIIASYRAILQRQEVGEAKPFIDLIEQASETFLRCPRCDLQMNEFLKDTDLWLEFQELKAKATTPPTAPSRDEIAKEIASFACRRHLINSNAYEALADRIFALINGASNAG